MTTRRWVLVLALTAVLCAGILLWQTFSDKGSIVNISQDGEILYSIDLSQISEPFSLTIPYGEQYNTVKVTRQAVWVEEASCGNQVCVDHGPLVENGSPITCLPHHLIISWAESQVDG